MLAFSGITVVLQVVSVVIQPLLLQSAPNNAKRSWDHILVSYCALSWHNCVFVSTLKKNRILYE